MVERLMARGDNRTVGARVLEPGRVESPEAWASGSTLTLLPHASRGDARAISLLLARMGPYLKRAWRGRFPSWARGRSDTQDLVQEALIRVETSPSFRGPIDRGLSKLVARGVPQPRD